MAEYLLLTYAGWPQTPVVPGGSRFGVLSKLAATTVPDIQAYCRQLKKERVAKGRTEIGRKIFSSHFGKKCDEYYFTRIFTGSQKTLQNMS